MNKLAFIADEIGLKTLLSSGIDVAILIAIRMIRLLGFGATSLILVIFLKELGMKEVTIGYFMTLTFFGDLISSFLFSLAADRLGRKLTLVFSSGIMAATGFAFAYFDNSLLLTTVAVIGILTPGGGEVGPFRSIEQSAIASLVRPEFRSDIYAWYTFLGVFCLALGSFLCGSLIDILLSYGYSTLQAYRTAFLAYGLLAVASLVLCLFITPKAELQPELEPVEDAGGATEALETGQLLPKQKPKRKFLPDLNSSILSMVLKLSILFGLDAFASSLVQGSWLTYYIKHKFDVSATTLGSIFFATYFIAGFASLLSTSLTKRLGPVVTMVATHLPASTLLIFLPLPHSLVITLAIMFVRASTQSMDVAPKHVFLATLVPPEFRTAIFGWTNIVKTLAQMFGPSIAGYLTGRELQWLTFVMAGSLKVCYDLGILATFLAYNRHNVH